MARVLVPLAEGFEELETAAIVDVLRRGGVEVVVAGLAGADPVKGSRGMLFVPDLAFDAAGGTWDMIALPGGAGGTERMIKHEGLLDLIRRSVTAKVPVAAICAAPRVLDAAGVLSPAGYTCYPGQEQLMKTPGRRQDLVLDTGKVITSQGPGTAVRFALYLLARLSGEEMRDRVAKAMLSRDL